MKRTPARPTTVPSRVLMLVFAAMVALGWSQYKPMGRMHGVAGMGQPALSDCGTGQSTLKGLGAGACQAGGGLRD